MLPRLVPPRASRAVLPRSKQIRLVAQVLPTVGLAEAHDAGGVEAPGLCGAPGGDAEAEGHVVHVVDDDALVLGAVLGPAADVGLDDVAAVEEGHLAVGLDPDLVAGVLGEDGEGGDVQAELARLCELACLVGVLETCGWGILRPRLKRMAVALVWE